MSIPTILLSPMESATRAGPVNLELRGAVRLETGRFGDTWFLEEGTTNIIPNPAPTTPWYIAPDAGTAITQSDPVSPSGWSNEITQTAVETFITAVPFDQQAGFTTTAPHTFSIYAWAEDPSQWETVEFDAFFRYTDVGAGQEPVQIAVTDTPQRVVKTLTPDPSRTMIGLGIYMRTKPKVAGAKIKFAAAQIEAKSYATTYADGSLGGGYVWSGTPHESASSRYGAYVVSPVSPQVVLGATEGTIIVRYNEPTRPHPHTGYLFRAGSWQNSFIGITRNAANIRTYFYGPSGVGANTSVVFASVPGQRTLAFTYDQNEITMRDDVGSLQSREIPVSYVLDFANKNLWVGNPSQDAQTGVESVVVFDHRLREPEIDRLLQSQEPWTWRSVLPRVGGTIRTVPQSPQIIERSFESF